MSARRVRVIVNPLAGHRPREDRFQAALAWLAVQGWAVERRESEWAGHARLLAADAAEAGCDAVLACGGDGTINEVVNGLAGSQTALAALPAGTVNIWAREVGLPRDPLGSVRLLAEGGRRRVDLGRAGERYFLLLASVGTDSFAVRAVSPAAKRRFGRYAFVGAGLWDLLRHGGRPMTILADGRRLRGRTLVAVIGNTRLYGGVLSATHRARLDDGLLDLCLYPGRFAPRLAAHAVNTLLSRHDRSGAVYLQARRIQFDGPAPLPVQADGEYIGETPMTFSVAPAALTVIVPPGLRSPLFGPGAAAAPTDERPAKR